MTVATGRKVKVRIRLYTCSISDAKHGKKIPLHLTAISTINTVLFCRGNAAVFCHRLVTKGPNSRVLGDSDSPHLEPITSERRRT